MNGNTWNMAEYQVFKFLREHFRTIPFILNAVIIILCMCVFIPTGKVSNQFNSECVLYSHLKVSLSDKDQVILDTRKEATVWGNPSTCNYVTYTPVVASLNSMIWCWFLYQNALKNDSGTSQSVLALLFSCIFHLLFTVVLLVSSCFLSAGKTAFCDDLGLQIPRYDCATLQSKVWTVTEPNSEISYPFFTYIRLAEVSCWLVTVTSLLACLLAGYQILARYGVYICNYDDDDDDIDDDVDEDDFEKYPYSRLRNGDISIDDTGSVIINYKFGDSRSVRSSVIDNRSVRSEPI